MSQETIEPVILDTVIVVGGIMYRRSGATGTWKAERGERAYTDAQLDEIVAQRREKK